MKLALFPILAAAFVSTGMISERVRPVLEYHVVRGSELDAHESHAAMSLIGQFRTNISSWLWLRADLYLHNGVEMRPLTERETQTGTEAMRSADGLDEHLHHEDEVTVIPDAERDFRGVFGDIERAVSAYQDMHGHHHNRPIEALPLFRLMTWLDPEFVPGWTAGAHIIATQKDAAAPDRALAYLNDGIVQNPNSVEIFTEQASLYITKKRDLSLAEPALKHAISLGCRQWPRMEEEEKDAFVTAFRYLALIYRDSGLPDTQRAAATQGLKYFKDDNVLKRLAQ